MTLINNTVRLINLLLESIGQLFLYGETAVREDPNHLKYTTLSWLKFMSLVKKKKKELYPYFDN